MQRQYLACAVALLVTVFMAMIGYRVTDRLEQGALDRQLVDRLTLARHSVTTEIEQFRYLPGVVAQDPRIARMLRDPTATTIAEANAYLETVRDVSNVDELYVLNLVGMTLAASNWRRPDGFVGQSYAFRPYFQDALANGEGRYYAVGATTGKPGYFLSLRLTAGHVPLGVIVVKVDMSPLEAAWLRADDQVGIADAEGIVFLAGQSGWKYRQLTPLSDGQLAELRQEFRYGGLVDTTRPALMDRSGHMRSGHGALRVAKGTVEPDGWQVVVAAPESPIRVAAATVATLAVLIGASLTALSLVLWQRNHIIRLRLDQADVLEASVAERTEALAHEVEERRLAQQELRRTHDSLVHAAKLAVLGRMAGAIVHEVSQPLSAMDATLAAAELHLARGNTVKAQASLGSARGLIRRMQDMVRALKAFGARQKPSPAEPVDVAAATAAALEILAPRLNELGVIATVDFAPTLVPVSGRAGPMQQVLTNLILNAAEATALASAPVSETVSETVPSPPAPVRIMAERGGEGDGVLIYSILDRGPGIPVELREKVFEPFFTTRVTGEGLGLGLSIVRSLLGDMGAQLSFGERPGGGTVTTITLQIYTGHVYAGRGQTP